jgi:hypothetical protein
MATVPSVAGLCFLEVQGSHDFIFAHPEKSRQLDKIKTSIRISLFFTKGATGAQRKIFAAF